MSVVAAPPRREPVSYFTRPVVGTLIAAAVALAIKLQPQIGQLDSSGQPALAVMVFAVGLWVSDALNPGITSVLALGLLTIAGVPSNVALGGFAGGAFWILVSVLFFGTAMDKTGLARRIAYRILLVVPPTCTDVDRIKLASVYFAVTIGALWIAVVYWRLLGLI
jgi:di/tricarboxylate transporter